MNRIGYVYYNSLYCGKIEELDDGYTFTYDDNYIANNDNMPISLTMPFKTDSYFSNILFPFFDGLIPEGWLLDLAIKKWKVNKNDRFGLLLTVCNDTIGAVSVRSVNS